MSQSEFKGIAPSQHQLWQKYAHASRDCVWFCFLKYWMVEKVGQVLLANQKAKKCKTKANATTI